MACKAKVVTPRPTAGLMTSPTVAPVRVTLVVAVPTMIFRLVAPMAICFAPVWPSRMDWNPKSPSSEAKPSTRSLRWPWMSVRSVTPGPRSAKSRITGPPGVWMVGRPAAADRSKPLRTRTNKSFAFRVSPGTPFKLVSARTELPLACNA